MASSNPPAFPREDYQADNAPGQRGMTLRDYFAGQALEAIVSRCACGESKPLDDMRDLMAEIAVAAYGYADAMLAERERTEGR